MVNRIRSLQMEYTSKELETSLYHMGETGQQVLEQMDIKLADKSQALGREQQIQHEELLTIVQSKDISKLKSPQGASSQLNAGRSHAELKTGMLKEHQKDKNIKQGRVATTSIMEATVNKNKKGPEARIVNLMEIFEPGESSEVQEQLVMKVEVGVGVEANIVPGKEVRKVVKAGRRKDGLVQTRIEGVLKLSGGVVVNNKRKQASMGGKLKPTSNKKKKK